MAVFYGWWIVLVCFILAFYIAGTVFYSFTAFVEPLAVHPSDSRTNSLGHWYPIILCHTGQT